ncbi:MAG: hypothetical protein WBD74_11815 [Candidatus Aquilonibacter sp.]
MRTTIIGALFALAALTLAAGCGSSSGNTTTPTAGPTPTATPTYIPTGAPSTTVPVGTASPNTASAANGKFGIYVVFPATTSGSGNMTVTGSTTVPSVPAGVTAYAPASGTTLFYVVLQPSATVKFPSYPQFQLTTPPSVVPQNNNFFGAVYTNDAAFPSGHNAWSAQFLGAASDQGQVLTFPNPSTPLTFTAGDSYVFAFYEVPS